MAYTLFSGCSYTYGTGFPLEKDDPALWVNLLHSHNQHLISTSLLNVSCGGRSNEGIFQDTVYNLLHNDIKYAIVEWSSMPRYNLSVGLELYQTKISVIPNATIVDQNLNDIKYTSKYLNSIRDRFTSLAHLHFEIYNLVYYVNSLIKLAKLTNTKIFFVNGMCPWDGNYFTKLENVLPGDYTAFTQRLINVDNRDDAEIYQLYEKIHTEYNLVGGINEYSWLNLYNSMREQLVDRNDDNSHPGTISNKNYYELFDAILNSKLETNDPQI